MADVRHRFITANGIRIHLAEAGEGPLVLLCHGFPESWYSWRHQLPALAEAGFHAVAPDMRGYGQTDAPDPIDAYTQFHIVADMVGILDALGVQTAVIVGHDWGAPVAWNAALWRPDRFRAVVGLSVPFTPRSPRPPTEAFKAIYGDQFFYILYFQEPGKAEAELERDVRRTVRMTLYSASGDGPDRSLLPVLPKTAGFLDGMVDPGEEKLPTWLRTEDLDFYTAEFLRRGFRGGLNWYRNMDRTWELAAPWADAKVTVPALFISGEKDVVRAMSPGAAEAMRKWVPNLRDVIWLSGCGHWTQQERPADVNAALIDFLRSL